MNAWTISLLIFIGAGCGGLARFWLAYGVDKQLHSHIAHIPVGTILVNILGSFLIGYVSSCSNQEWVKYLIMVGLLGGFTTFSTFSLQTIELLHKGGHLALINVLVSLVCCVAGCVMGIGLGRLLHGN